MQTRFSKAPGITGTKPRACRYVTAPWPESGGPSGRVRDADPFFKGCQRYHDRLKTGLKQRVAGWAVAWRTGVSGCWSLLSYFVSDQSREASATHPLSAPERHKPTQFLSPGNRSEAEIDCHGQPEGERSESKDRGGEAPPLRMHEAPPLTPTSPPWMSWTMPCPRGGEEIRFVEAL